eukprot:Blabericola_migrator_1__1511@NODE_139_length_13119_cov_94_960389_g121_i0_p6_GENE_NODE_139_length_13119_cov_94_960389_g121_i0NODE_139_length_13119_cov_94_960389_g121_i0_p6_ORF_typecomplete_len336_score48_40LysM/PF01476_20/2_9e06_NODE_139_length_13119_cov_94_960389_g121_i013622369
MLPILVIVSMTGVQRVWGLWQPVVPLYRLYIVIGFGPFQPKMHGINYIPFTDEVLDEPIRSPQTLINKPVLLPKLATSIPHVVHEVTNTDTLPRLALKYGVSVAAIRRVNRLPSDDIWFRKTLVIPVSPEATAITRITTDISSDERLFQNRHSDTAAVPIDPEGDAVKKRVETHQKIVFMAKLTDLEFDHCRQILLHTDGDVGKALTICEWINDEVRVNCGQVTPPELLAYLRMNDFDTDRARDALMRDMLWEQMHKLQTQQSPPQESPLCGLLDRRRGRGRSERSGRLASDCESDDLIEVLGKKRDTTLKCRRGIKTLTLQRNAQIEMEGKKSR